MKTKILLMLISLLSFNSILNAQDDELKAEIIFSDQPFIGDAGDNKLRSDFKAGSEIYARIKFSKPMKDLFKGYFSGAHLKVNNREGAAKLTFKIKYEKNGETVFGAADKHVSLEELNNAYVDFDIAPSLNKSRDAYRTGFAGAIARSNPYIEEGMITDRKWRIRI
ncbi:MAG: hypothetical protein K0S12_2385 [Bacteroidetes bacterium]|nr:hypothetical protein [Bacteroidota bacterium]